MYINAAWFFLKHKNSQSKMALTLADYLSEIREDLHRPKQLELTVMKSTDNVLISHYDSNLNPYKIQILIIGFYHKNNNKYKYIAMELIRIIILYFDSFCYWNITLHNHYHPYFYWNIAPLTKIYKNALFNKYQNIINKTQLAQ